MQSARHPREAALLAALFLTGARVGELLSADASELRGNTLTKAKHKTAKHVGDKEIPLPASVVRDIGGLDRGTSLRLFGAVSPTTFRRVWGSVRDAAGVPDLTLRDARRTFASYCIGSGFGLDQIGELFGHTSTQTTKGYAWMLDDARTALAEAGAAEIQRIADGGK